MDEVIAPVSAGTLADAVMPDNRIESVTDKLRREDEAAQTEAAQLQQAVNTLDSESAAQPPASYTINLPEGMYLSDAMRDAFTATAHKYGLTNEAANALIALHVQQINAHDREQASRTADRSAQYERATRQDPEIGGAKFDAAITAAKIALNKFGTKGLIDVLDETGLGNHPEIVRLFARLGKSIAEGRYVPTQGQPTPEKPRGAAALYPNMK